MRKSQGSPTRQGTNDQLAAQRLGDSCTVDGTVNQTPPPLLPFSCREAACLLSVAHLHGAFDVTHPSGPRSV